MYKSQSNELKENEPSSVVREYLNLCNDSSDLIKFMCDQYNEISLCSENEASLQGDNLDYQNRSENFQDGRAPSPSSISSLASGPSGRRLEWDSGADVGYQPSTSTYPNTLSTLERMALGGCAEALIRTDPEGTNSCSSGVVNPLHTSITPSSHTPRKDSKPDNNSKLVTSPREVSGVVKLPMFTNNEAVSLNSDKEEEHASKNLQNNPTYDNDSHDCISAETDTNDILQHGEECPVNKNVTEHVSSDEDMIFKQIKSGMNTNSASSSSLASTIINPVQESLHAHSKKLISYKKVVTRGIQVGGTLQRSESVQVLESILSSRLSHHTEDEYTGEDYHGDSCKKTQVTVPESIDTSSFDRANSFEYFPGNMCERSASRNGAIEKKEIKSDATLKVSQSLSKDLEEYIARVIQKKLSAAKKKALVKELVERIIESEYLDDVEDKQLPRKSAESSVKSGRSTSGSTGSSAKVKQNKGTNEEKIFVPYRPIPGGKTYLVAGEKVVQTSETSVSCSETDTSGPAVFYYPIDRIKPMKHLNSTSDERPDSALSSQPPKSDDDRYNSCLKNLRQLREQLKNKCLVAEFSESEGSKKTQEDDHHYFNKERPRQKERWWSPDTKSEKKRLLEAARKNQNPVLNFLEREKESQLNWIKNEINHLSNLAQLLEECEISKAETSTSVEEQISLLSSLRRTRKATKNVSNKVDKLLSSAKSSCIEEPIVPDLKNPQHSSHERISQSTSPLMEKHSTQTTSVDYCSNQSTVASSSVPSRIYSRNSATLDPKPTEQVHRDQDNKKTSEAYLITFEAGTPEKDIMDQRQRASRKSLKEVKLKIPSRKEKSNGNSLVECHTVSSLKEQLEVHRPEFIRNAEERQKCLEELAHLRALRQATRRKLLHFNLVTHQNLQKEKQDISKPKSAPAKAIGKSSGKQKENSEPVRLKEKRRLKRALPEYQQKEAEQRKKQYYQANRLLADIYSKKLQKKVLKGAVSLSVSESVISTL